MRTFAVALWTVGMLLFGVVGSSSAIQVKFEGDGFATLSPSIWAGQLDTDPALEVIVVTGSRSLVIRDGATGAIELSLSWPPGLSDPNKIAATFADVDGDGAAEAIVCVTHTPEGTGPGAGWSRFWVIDGAPVATAMDRSDGAAACLSAAGDSR